jgi:zinc/manganese transport system ATP-binding protein
MTHTAMTAAVRFDNLTLGYERHPAVHHLNGEIAAGALLAVVGPNGAGKSTLLKALTGEIKPLQGSFRLRDGREQLAYLPQQSELDRSFPVSVFDMVAMGLWREIGAFGGLSRSQRERVRHTLEAVGLSGMETRRIGVLSGGQLQRARFARLMLQDAPLLLLDEPFNAIDSRTIEDLIALILDWHAEGRTIVAVLHDLELATRERGLHFDGFGQRLDAEHLLDEIESGVELALGGAERLGLEVGRGLVHGRERLFHRVRGFLGHGLVGVVGFLGLNHALLGHLAERDGHLEGREIGGGFLRGGFRRRFFLGGNVGHIGLPCLCRLATP